MKRIQFSFGISSEMLPFFEKVIDENRAQFREFGFSMSKQDVVDMILYDAIRKECEKFGYNG